MSLRFSPRVWYPSDFHTAFPIALQTLSSFFEERHSLVVKHYSYFKIMFEELMNIDLRDWALIKKLINIFRIIQIKTFSTNGLLAVDLDMYALCTVLCPEDNTLTCKQHLFIKFDHLDLPTPLIYSPAIYPTWTLCHKPGSLQDTDQRY